MSGVQKAIIPGIIISCLMLLSLNRLVNPPAAASAATEQPAKIVIQSKEGNSVNEWEDCSYAERYPSGILQWCRIIEENAEEFGLDPLLIAAVMKVESGGQPQVISHSGAVGLMQVMPRDGIAAGFQCINGPCFASRPMTDELLDPGFNVAFGTRMLSGLIEKQGNLRDALKSYGPYDVGYWYADLVLQLYESL